MTKTSFTTPIGVARFPKISKPDTTGDYADGKYKTDVVFSDADMKAVKAQIVAFAKEQYGDDLSKIRLPIGEHTDKETKEVTTYVRFKSARKPIVVDAKRKRLPEGVEVGGGSRIRVGGTLNAYKAAGNTGVNIYLNAVQVIELQQGFSVDEFEEYNGEDAYVADPVAEDTGEDSDFDL